MTGVIRAQLILNNLDEATSSLEFLNELSSTLGQSAVSYYVLTVVHLHCGKLLATYSCTLTLW